MPRHWIAVAAAVGLLAFAADQAQAQPYPTRPIRLIIPFAPGGAPDFMARPVAAQVEAQIGQPVVVENRTGANGILGMQAVATAEPDGYTLLHAVPAFVINPSVYKKLPFDIFKDFSPIAPLGLGTGYLLVVKSQLPVHSVRELIDYAKNNRVLYGSPGVGNTLHLAAELFNVAAGIQMEHVPFRGAAPVHAAMLAGTIDATFAANAALVEQVHAGKMRAIGFTGSAPSRDLPNVPLIRDTLPGFKIEGAWHGWLAPGNTAPAILDRINAQVRVALKVPKVRQAIELAGYDPIDMSPGQFAGFLREETERYAQAVRAAKIEPQ